MSEVPFPYSYYPDPENGGPLFAGSIFVGIPDLDPETLANQIPVMGRQENGTLVPLIQPIATSAAGLPTYNGSDVVLVVNASVFSVKVLDKDNDQAYYQPRVDGVLTSSQIVTPLDSTSDIAASGLPVGALIQTAGYASSGDGGDALYQVVGSGVGDPIFFIPISNGNRAKRIKIPQQVFSTVSNMVASPWIGEGDNAKTNGYLSENDGGGSSYKIVAGGTGVADEGSFIDLANGYQANLIATRSVNASSYGVLPAQSAITNSTRLLAAINSTTHDILIPDGSFSFALDNTNAQDILTSLNRITALGSCEFSIGAGDINFTEQIVINTPYAKNITIKGSPRIDATLTSQISVSGASKNYSVNLGVSSSAGVSIGDYALIRTNVTGTGDFYAQMGVWKVVAIDSGGANRVTVLNTHHGSSFPVNTVTGGDVAFLTTRCIFAGVDGFRFEGGSSLKDFDLLAIVGDWDVATSTGTTGPHGIITCAPVLTGGGSSNASYDPAGFVRTGDNIGVSAFGEQGIAVSGRGHMISNFVSSCSNRKRGMYSEGSHIRAKFAVCSGNGEDGFISDTTGFLQVALSVASGNGLNGYFQINNSMIAAATSRSTGNGSNGYESRGAGRIGADITISLNNAFDGYSANDGGMIDADGATADGNFDDGFSSVNGAVIDCNNSIAQNNVGFAYESFNGSVINAPGATLSANGGEYNSSNSIITQSSGSLYPSPQEFGTTQVYNSNRLHNTQVSVSSIGDSFISLDGTARIIIKNGDGEFRPVADNLQNLGGAANRWKEVFAGAGAINTSDELEKTKIEQLSDKERRAALEIKSVIGSFRFKDSVDSKAGSARIHVGVGAQTVEKILKSNGLDPFSYSFLCRDSWEGEPEVVVDGNVISKERKAGSRYGIRYDQLLCFIISAI